MKNFFIFAFFCFLLLVGGTIFFFKAAFLPDQKGMKKTTTSVEQTTNLDYIQSQESSPSIPGTVKLFLEPSSASWVPGKVIPVKVQVDAGGDYTNIAIINLSFGKGLELDQKGCKIGSLFGNFPDTKGCYVDKSERTVHLTLQANEAKGPSGVSTLAILDLSDNSSKPDKIIFSGSQQIYTQQKDGSTIVAKVETEDGEY